MRHDLKRQAEANIDRSIQMIGVALQQNCTTFEGEHLSLIHTIGLHELGLPELVVFNIRPDVGAQLLGCLQQAFKELPKGTPLAGKHHLEGWPFPTYLLDVSEVAEPFLWAAWARAVRMKKAEQPMRILQATVCDKQGRFPWEPGCDSSIVEMHSILGKLPQ